MSTINVSTVKPRVSPMSKPTRERTRERGKNYEWEQQVDDNGDPISFESHDEAREYFQSDELRKRNHSKEGLKKSTDGSIETITSYCRGRDCSCKLRVRIFVADPTSKPKLERVNECICKELKANDRGLTLEQKAAVDEFLGSNVLKPLNMLMMWQDKYPDIPAPSQQKISNYKLTKKKKDDPGDMALEDLQDWITYHEPSDDLDKAFVVRFWTGNGDANENLFRIALSTKRMLSYTPDKIHCDSTYKLTVTAGGCFLLGFDDIERKFHPVIFGVSSRETADDFEWFYKCWKDNNEALEPAFIMSDAAEAIPNGAKKIWPTIKRLMCYSHVYMVSVFLIKYNETQSIIFTKHQICLVSIKHVQFDAN
jgi:MULE transposase domain